MLKETCVKDYEALAGPLRREFEEAQIEQIFKTIKELPTINVEMKLRGSLREEIEITRIVNQPLNRNSWLEVHADEAYTLMVNLHRLGARSSEFIYSHFPKPKTEGWFLTLGNQENGELIALKRCGYKSNRSTSPLIFVAPSKLGRVIYTVYLISDGQIGLDQQYNVQLQVIENLKEKQMLPMYDSLFSSDDYHYSAKDKL